MSSCGGHHQSCFVGRAMPRGREANSQVVHAECERHVRWCSPSAFAVSGEGILSWQKEGEMNVERMKHALSPGATQRSRNCLTILRVPLQDCNARCRAKLARHIPANLLTHDQFTPLAARSYHPPQGCPGVCRRHVCSRIFLRLHDTYDCRERSNCFYVAQVQSVPLTSTICRSQRDSLSRVSRSLFRAWLLFRQ